MQAAVNEQDLRDFFANHQLAGELPVGSAPTRAGEVLVEQRIVTRHQLLRALQLQDQSPSARIGDCVAALGFVERAAVEPVLEHSRLSRLADVIIELDRETSSAAQLSVQ